MRCSHTSPFEACEIKFHVKCPIFVARQWQRHRTGSYNEISGRYSIIKDEYYIPDEDRIVKQSLNNRQCSGIDAVPHRKSIINRIKKILEKSYKFYKELVDRNVAREISRSVLSQSMYTEFYWKIDLHNLMHFVKLRADMHAQQEIRIYANKIMDILKVWTPITYEAFLNYKMHSKTFSRDVLALLKKRLNGEIFDEEKSGLNKREWIEYKDFLM